MKILCWPPLAILGLVLTPSSLEASEIDATRLLVWEAAWKVDRGEDATREACLARNYATNMVLKVTDNAVQVLGGHGYIRDHLVELFLRNGRGFAAFEGLAIA